MLVPELAEVWELELVPVLVPELDQGWELVLHLVLE
jgi:hypothetical protein